MDARVWTGRLLDAVTYAALVAVLVTAVAAIVSFPLGYGWVGVKYGLFWVGWLTFGYAVFTLRPTPPWKDEDERSGESIPKGNAGETRFQRVVQSLPPARFVPLPKVDRLPESVKLFLSAIALLATSFALEAVFGVA